MQAVSPGSALQTGRATGRDSHYQPPSTKRRGQHVGRPRALPEGQIQYASELITQGKTKREVAELLGVSPNTVGRAFVK